MSVLTAVDVHAGHAVRDEVTALDLFSGVGGSSDGLRKAGIRMIAAANHRKLAVETHAANFPDADHFVADMVDTDAAAYLDAADLPYADVLWASPACTHHSMANAKKAYRQGTTLFDTIEDPEFEEAVTKSERSRATAVCVLRYANRHHPKVIMVENVVQFALWGPNRDGSSYRWWRHELEKLGYNVAECWLNSMFFPPTPQSRDRMYVVATRTDLPMPDLEHRPDAWCPTCDTTTVAVQAWKPRKAAWPLPHWGIYDKQYTYACEACRTRVYPPAFGAWTAIDWSDPGQRIGDRARPLADSTMDRIRRGLERRAYLPPFVVDGAVVPFRANTHPTAFDQPMPCQTAQQVPGMVTGGMLVKNHGGWERRGAQSLADPLGALTTSPTGAVAQVMGGMTVTAAGNTFERPGSICRVRPLTEPGYTQHTTNAFGVASVPLAMFAKNNGPADATTYHNTASPFGSLLTRDTTSLAMTGWVDNYTGEASRLLDPLRTLLTHDQKALATLVDGPPPAVEDVWFRMLRTEEIRRGMAFPDDYVLLGNNTERVLGLGNAVTPPVPTWIAGRALAVLHADRTVAA